MTNKANGRMEHLKLKVFCKSKKVTQFVSPKIHTTCKSIWYL